MTRDETQKVLDKLTDPAAVCEKCKLQDSCESPQMAGSGNWYKPKLAIVAEAPGEDEDKADEPLLGAALRLVVKTMEGLGLDMEKDVWLTNAVRCAPSKGKVTDRAVKLCREFLRQELDAVQPDVVLTLGAAPMFSLTEQKGIMSLHGHVHEMELGGKKTPVVHAFHPSFILRDPSRVDDFCDDVERAVGLLETGGKVVKSPVNYRIIKNSEDLTELAREVSSREIVSWDIETTGVSPFAEGAAVVCVSIATQKNTGWLLLIDHDRADEVCAIPRSERIDWLKWLLESSPASLFGQNLKFDMGYVRVVLGIHPRTPAMDVYIAHHLLDEDASKNRGNALKVMARKYTDMGDYEQPAIRRAGGEQAFYDGMKSSYVEPEDGVSFEETMTYYACADVDSVLRIAEVLLPRLEAENLLPVLSLEMHKTMMLTDLEVSGASIDWDYHGTLATAFPEEMERILAIIREYPQVKLAAHYYAQGRKTPREAEPFNVNSPAQVSTLVFDVLNLPAGKKTKAGKDSTGKESVQEWLEMLEPGSDAYTILTELMRYKQLSKLNSAYVEPLPTYRGVDGKIHTRFNQGFVATWRLSSQSPNLQQLPRNDDGASSEGIGKGSIKRMFVGGKPGWWVAEADYSQIELRVAGLISQDKGFIENYRNNEDLHSRTACSIYGVSPENLEKAQRTAAKIVNFGILFGMNAPALSRQLRTSMKEAERMISIFWETYTGFSAWVKQTEEFLRKNHYVESMFGHRRHLPNVAARDLGLAVHAERQGVNFPIQCTASNLTMYAETFICQIFRENGMESYCFGQVHDSIWVTGPPHEREEALAIVKTVMENPGFPFLTGEDPRYPLAVPIVADVNVGMNLRDLEKWEPA